MWQLWLTQVFGSLIAAMNASLWVASSSRSSRIASRTVASLFSSSVNQVVVVGKSEISSVSHGGDDKGRTREDEIPSSTDHHCSYALNHEEPLPASCVGEALHALDDASSQETAKGTR